MKLKQVNYLLSGLMLFLLLGCSNIEDTLSKQEAQKLVIEKHKNENGSPEIISTKIKWNAYYIKWGKKENLESGTDKVDKNGTVTLIEAKIE